MRRASTTRKRATRSWSAAANECRGRRSGRDSRTSASRLRHRRPEPNQRGGERGDTKEPEPPPQAGGIGDPPDDRRAAEEAHVAGGAEPADDDAGTLGALTRIREEQRPVHRRAHGGGP